MSHESVVKAKPTKNWALFYAEKIVFNVRWLLPLFYVGLVVVLGLYLYTFIMEIFHICKQITEMSTDDMKLAALDIVDVVMIANLIKMIITGSWNSFISKDHGYKNENITSGMLKIKITTSVIVVCSIHLLKSFVQPTVNWDLLEKQLLIYVAFVISGIVLGFLEYLHVKQEVMEHEHEAVSKH